MSREFPVILAVVVLFVQAPGVFADDNEPACRSVQESWSKAFTLLKEKTQALRDTKEQGVTQRIEEKLSEEAPGRPIALIVRSVLEQHRNDMAQARLGCRELADMERIAYEQWRRCSVGRRGPRVPSSSERPEAFLQDRNALLNLLSDLMLDEAFLQYKTSRPVHARANSERGSEGAYASGSQRSGYGARRAPADPGQFAEYGSAYRGYWR